MSEVHVPNIDEMRAGLDLLAVRADRFRWILQNPKRAQEILTECLNEFPDRQDKAALRFNDCVELERQRQAASAKVWGPTLRKVAEVNYRAGELFEREQIRRA